MTGHGDSSEGGVALRLMSWVLFAPTVGETNGILSPGALLALTLPVDLVSSLYLATCP